MGFDGSLWLDLLVSDRVHLISAYAAESQPKRQGKERRAGQVPLYTKGNGANMGPMLELKNDEQQGYFDRLHFRHSVILTGLAS